MMKMRTAEGWDEKDLALIRSYSMKDECSCRSCESNTSNAVGRDQNKPLRPEIRIAHGPDDEICGGLGRIGIRKSNAAAERVSRFKAVQ